jgi:hypothetical protein
LPKKKSVIFILVALLAVLNVYAQPRQVKRAIRAKDQKEVQAKKDYDKKRKAVLKHRFDIQNKEVQERMKLSAKKSDLYNKS